MYKPCYTHKFSTNSIPVYQSGMDPEQYHRGWGVDIVIIPVQISMKHKKLLKLVISNYTLKIM